MDIWDALRIILRRWYAVLPVLIVFVVMAFVSSGRIDADYEADASVILLGPNQAIPDGVDVPAQQINAYLTPCSTCETVARVLELSLSSTATHDEFRDAGLSPDYTLATERRSPIIELAATSREPATAVNTVDALIDRVAAELDSRQGDVNAPEAQRISVSVLSQDSAPTGDRSAATRVRLALLAVGVGAAAVAAFLIEGLVYFLRQRKEGPKDSLNGNGDGGGHSARHSARSPLPDFDPSPVPSGPSGGRVPPEPTRTPSY